MGCADGSCSCGKGNHTAQEENIRLVQLSTGQGMLPAFDWMKGPGNLTVEDEVVEIRFKNNRKMFFRNRFGLSLVKEDRVVVETQGGQDIGTVSLTGNLAEKQYQPLRSDIDKNELRKVLRKATETDTNNWLNAKRREREVLREARRIPFSLGLEMRISDVEFQGDGRKVTIYYTTDKLIDLYELIKAYGAAFSVRIEMKKNEVRKNNFM